MNNLKIRLFKNQSFAEKDLRHYIKNYSEETIRD